MYDAPRLCPPTHKAVGSTVRCPRCFELGLTLLEENLVKMVKRCTNRQSRWTCWRKSDMPSRSVASWSSCPSGAIRRVLDEGHGHSFGRKVVDPILVGFNI